MSRLTNDVEYLRASLAASIGNLVKDSLTLLGLLVWCSRLVAAGAAVAADPAARRAAAGHDRPQDAQALGCRAGADGRPDRHPAGDHRRRARREGVRHGESEERRRFDDANQRFFRAFVRLRRVSAAAAPVSEFAIVVVAVAMLWLGGREIFVTHTLAPTSSCCSSCALLTTISPIKSLSEVNANMQQGLAAAGADLRGCSTPRPTIVDRAGARDAAAVPRRDPLRARLVRLRAANARAARRVVRDRARRGGGAGGLERRGQEHDAWTCWRASTTRRRAASRSTASTCATPR